MSGQKKRQQLFGNNEYARQMTILNDYGNDADIYDHRDKLNNSFIEYFKLNEFYAEFSTEEKRSDLDLRKMLYLFVSRETQTVCPSYDHIRKIIHKFFSRINNKMIKTSDGYFWRQKVKSMNAQRQGIYIILTKKQKKVDVLLISLVTRGLGSLEVASLKQYADHWANMIMMLARTINQESDEEKCSRILVFRLKKDHEQRTKAKITKTTV